MENQNEINYLWLTAFSKLSPELIFPGFLIAKEFLFMSRGYKNKSVPISAKEIGYLVFLFFKLLDYFG